MKWNKKINKNRIFFSNVENEFQIQQQASHIHLTRIFFFFLFRILHPCLLIIIMLCPVLWKNFNLLWISKLEPHGFGVTVGGVRYLSPIQWGEGKDTKWRKLLTCAFFSTPLLSTLSFLLSNLVKKYWGGKWHLFIKLVNQHIHKSDQWQRIWLVDDFASGTDQFHTASFFISLMFSTKLI